MKTHTKNVPETGAPVVVAGGQGLQGSGRLGQLHGKVVGVQDCKVAEELLHLDHPLMGIDFRQVLQADVLHAVGEDCGHLGVRI